jgi:hypothetical protein
LSNKTIANNLEIQFREFESMQLSATDLESSIEHSVQAMEGITQRGVEVTRELAYQLVAAVLEDESPSGQFGPNVVSALGALRESIEHLARP